MSRTKYASYEDALEQFEKMKNLGVIGNSHSVYKCPECNLWHVGMN